MHEEEEYDEKVLVEDVLDLVVEVDDEGMVICMLDDVAQVVVADAHKEEEDLSYVEQDSLVDAHVAVDLH